MKTLFLLLSVFFGRSIQEPITEDADAILTWNFDFDPRNKEFSCVWDSSSFLKSSLGYLNVVKFYNRDRDTSFYSRKFTNRVTVADINDRSFSLRIKNVNMDDDGNYICLYYGWFKIYHYENRLHVVHSKVVSGVNLVNMSWPAIPQMCQWRTPTRYVSVWLNDYKVAHDTRDYIAETNVPGLRTISLDEEELKISVAPFYINNYDFTCFLKNGSSLTYRVQYTGEKSGINYNTGVKTIDKT